MTFPNSHSPVNVRRAPPKKTTRRKPPPTGFTTTPEERDEHRARLAARPKCASDEDLAALRLWLADLCGQLHSVGDALRNPNHPLTVALGGEKAKELYAACERASHELVNVKPLRVPEFVK